jgi:hypothetical protein
MCESRRAAGEVRFVCEVHVTRLFHFLMPRSLPVLCSTCCKVSSIANDADPCRCIQVYGSERIPGPLHQILAEFQPLKKPIVTAEEGKTKKRKRSQGRKKLEFHPSNFLGSISNKEWKELILGCYVQSTVLPSKEEKALSFPETIEIPLEPSKPDEAKENAIWTRVVQTNQTAALYKLEKVPQCYQQHAQRICGVEKVISSLYRFNNAKR